MLKIQEIREIIKLVDQSSIDEFSFEHDGSKIKMKKHSGESETVVRNVGSSSVPVAPVLQQAVSGAPQAPAAIETDQAVKEEVKSELNTDNLHKITSPMVGTFYSASSPEAEAFVKEGTKVNDDSVVCIVEAMKLFNEIEAEIKGEIVEVLAQDGQLVEYGQPLFLVKA
ncbi:acetyl-CoA carboxylase biotin carboxyl carrier protein [Metabacillus herbersteinensis]|uniref:Biotin carboxyl carrier protein of acetyl-CoA carboxylase n=1 Tax=Metabacillus herbersteinensis TaxID=283816 RepID=A0ABV6G890_9BACI